VETDPELHERSENRLKTAGGDGSASGYASAAMGLNGRRGGSGGSAQRQQRGAVECFSCGGKGHIARHCTAGSQDTRRRSGNDPDDHAEGQSRQSQQRAEAALGMRFASISSDSEDEQNEWACGATMLGARRPASGEPPESGERVDHGHQRGRLAGRTRQQQQPQGGRAALTQQIKTKEQGRNGQRATLGAASRTATKEDRDEILSL
jgi:hypothetical protein